MYKIKGRSIESMDERAPRLAEGVEQLHISMVMDRSSCQLKVAEEVVC
jgi:hypothetical protein